MAHRAWIVLIVAAAAAAESTCKGFKAAGGASWARDVMLRDGYKAGDAHVAPADLAERLARIAKSARFRDLLGPMRDELERSLGRCRPAAKSKKDAIDELERVLAHSRARHSEGKWARKNAGQGSEFKSGWVLVYGNRIFVHSNFMEIPTAPKHVVMMREAATMVGLPNALYRVNAGTHGPEECEAVTLTLTKQFGYDQCGVLVPNVYFKNGRLADWDSESSNSTGRHGDVVEQDAVPLAARGAGTELRGAPSRLQRRARSGRVSPNAAATPASASSELFPSRSWPSIIVRSTRFRSPSEYPRRAPRRRRDSSPRHIHVAPRGVAASRPAKTARRDSNVWPGAGEARRGAREGEGARHHADRPGRRRLAGATRNDVRGREGPGVRDLRGRADQITSGPGGGRGRARRRAAPARDGEDARGRRDRGAHDRDGPGGDRPSRAAFKMQVARVFLTIVVRAGPAR